MRPLQGEHVVIFICNTYMETKHGTFKRQMSLSSQEADTLIPTVCLELIELTANITGLNFKANLAGAGSMPIRRFDPILLVKARDAVCNEILPPCSALQFF